MNVYCHLRAGMLLWGTVACLASADLQATPTNVVASTNALAIGTNGIPLSVFEVNLAAGKDPFFPRSGRRVIEVSSASESQAATALMLQGFSGSANRRLAIINNHTFAAGDEGEVVTAAGRIKIRCEEIKDNMVAITVGNSTQRVELQLPSRF
jgi:hypothetical protein